MTAEANISLIQKLYAAFGKGDVAAILEYVDDDVDWGIEAMSSLEVPWHGTGRGKQFAAKFFQALASECAFTRFEPHGFVASETAVACLVSFDTTMKRTGRKSTQNAMHYFTIDRGRVTRWRGSEDTAYVKALFNA